MDSEHGSGSSSRHSIRDSGRVLSFASFSPLDGPEQGKGNSSHPITAPEATGSEDVVSPSNRLKSFSFDFPSPADYTSEDFIQIDPKVDFDPRAYDTTIAGNVHTLDRYDKNGVSGDHRPKSGHDGGYSWENSQASDLTPESLTSLTESPPIQVMERPAGFEPDRIPSSVFAVKSPTPADWSAASTDSLFSIHIGNNSIARDNLMLSGEIHKSREMHKPGNSPIPDELFKSGGPCSFGGSYKSPGRTSCSAPLPDISGRGSDRKIMTFGKTKVEADKTIMDSPMKTANAHEASIKPFVVTKKKKHACPLCHCSNFSCGFSCSTRPSCCRWQSWRCCKFSSCCRWPSCSCCKSPSCGCCKWPSCNCCKWPSCSYCSCRCIFSCDWNCRRRTFCC